jgi:hypothetical protein
MGDGVSLVEDLLTRVALAALGWSILGPLGVAGVLLGLWARAAFRRQPPPARS